jgi:6-phosphogluconolactonase
MVEGRELAMIRMTRGQKAKRGLALLAIGVLIAATGCGVFFIHGTTTSSSTSGDIVYVANGTTDTLAGFVVGTGTLTAVASSPYALGYSPTAVVVTPTDSFVYVGGTSAVYGYSIGTGGVLTALNNGSAVGTANVESMVISPDGNWLFVLDSNATTVDLFQINTTTGLLTQVTGASYAVSGATVVPRAIAIAPNGDFLFVALGTAGDLVFTCNTSTGALASSQQLAPLSTTTTDNALAVNPESTFLYIARSGTAGGLYAFAIGTNGALTEVGGSPFATGTQPYALLVNSAGTDIYVANRTDGTISGFSIAGTGALTALSGSPYTSGNAVSALGEDRAGTYLLAAANGGAPDLTMYSFDSAIAGKLDLAAATTTGTDPTGPVALAMTH